MTENRKDEQEKNEQQVNSEEEQIYAEQEAGPGDEAENEPELSLEELTKICQEKVCPECPVAQEKEQEMLRVRADAENFRKRMSREKEQFCKYAAEGILEDLLVVLDNLDLALEHGKKVEACKDLVQGVEMTRNMFLDTLKKHGLEPVECEIGQDFDPAWHEAMAEQGTEEMEKGKVCGLMQKGYKIKDRLLRPARVMVSKNNKKT